MSLVSATPPPTEHVHGFLWWLKNQPERKCRSSDEHRVVISELRIRRGHVSFLSRGHCSSDCPIGCSSLTWVQGVGSGATTTSIDTNKVSEARSDLHQPGDLNCLAIVCAHFLCASFWPRWRDVLTTAILHDRPGEI